MRWLITISLLLLCACVYPAYGQDYIPSGVGTLIQYVGVNDSNNYATWSVEEPIDGNVVLVLEENGGADFNAMYQFELEPDGDCYLIADSFDGGAVWNIYNPPAVNIDSPPYDGQMYTSTSEVNGVVFRLEVAVAEELITVPAGTYITFRTEQTIYFDDVLYGSHTNWNAQGIGPVKFDWTNWATTDVYVMTDATVVPSESLAWGDIKALYK